jgi:hypothetical protein
VDAAGLPRCLLTIEITESVIGENFEFMKEQIERFQQLGFKVWMDDFGSGYSSLDLLQEIHFDLIKFDMRFMRKFNEKPESRIILTELMRMAASLDTETVAEGVETAQQFEFLGGIGCTKVQGYYFCKPIPMSEILDRYDKGVQIGFEDPAEISYNRMVSNINLSNLGANFDENETLSDQYFNTQPMFVVEYDGNVAKVVRGNQAYREFVESHPGHIQVGQTVNVSDIKDEIGTAFHNSVKMCKEDGQFVFSDEKLEDGAILHTMTRKLMDNPVNKMAAYVIVMLGISKNNS